MMKTYLVVDDEIVVGEMISDMLSDSDINIELALNGEEAINILSQKKIDLVVTDIVMPGKNGIDLIMKLKDSYADIPVVAISGGGGIDGRFDYLEIAKLVGANSILRKPFSLESLKKSVSTALNSSQLNEPII